jgi:hypothetical protein
LWGISGNDEHPAILEQGTSVLNGFWPQKMGWNL